MSVSHLTLLFVHYVTIQHDTGQEMTKSPHKTRGTQDRYYDTFFSV